MKRKLIFLTSRFPYPLNKGDKLRAYNQIKDLSKFADIHLISLSEEKPSKDDFDALLPFCASINNFELSKKKRLLGLLFNLFTCLPFSVKYFYSSKHAGKIKHLIEKINPDVVHCHLIRTAPYVHGLNLPLKSIDFMDCFSVGALRELGFKKSPIRKMFLRIEYKRLKKFEEKTFQKFDIHFIISQPDRDAMPIRESSKIHILPNGVDYNIFYPNNITKNYDLLFSGHMGYIPNISAAKYTITKVLPLLSKNISFLIAGIGVSSEISGLKGENIIIREEFSHIREAFWMSKILIAPMNISIGLQNKIIQAMAMKIPVVCSSQANASIEAPKDNAILIANSPLEYASAIQRLLSDNNLYNEIAENAYDFVKSRFVWSKINAHFANLILDVK